LYPVLSYDPYFLYNYGAVLTLNQEYKQAIEILNKAKLKLNDYDVHFYLGICYKELNLNNKAIYYFTKASLLIPSRFYPKYMLVKIYEKTGNRNKMLELANDILLMNPKVNSDIIMQMKKEMKILIKQSNK